jgi:putative endonuclease
MQYFVYILYSRKYKRYYIGHTNDVECRVAQHNDADAKGWTRSFQPWEVMYVEPYPSRSGAMRQEKYLKSFKSKERIEQYIAGWRSSTSRGS